MLIKKIDVVRLIAQLRFIVVWLRNGGKGTLEAVTGFGKTFVGLLAIKHLNKRRPEYNIHIIVPTEYLKNKWELDIQEMGLKNCEVYIINTYARKRRKCDLLLLDEIHNYAAPTFRMMFALTEYKWVMGLTATIERSDGKHIILTQRAPILRTVAIQEAEDKGWVAKHVIYNLGVNFDTVDQDAYDKHTEVFAKYFAKFNGEFELAMACSLGGQRLRQVGEMSMTPAEWRRWYCTQMGFDPDSEDYITEGGKQAPNPYYPNRLYHYASQWREAMQKRSQLIYKSHTKLQIGIELVKKFEDKKIITFFQDAETCDQFTEMLRTIGIGARSYHTKLETELRNGKKFGKTKLKREALQLFNSGKIRVLNTVKALDEGYDVQDVDMEIQFAYTSTKRQNIQRTGRSIRFVIGKIAIIINLYINDSQEEKWLKQKQKGGKTPIAINSIDQITIGV